jgi:hypothetical protein
MKPTDLKTAMAAIRMYTNLKGRVDGGDVLNDYEIPYKGGAKDLIGKTPLRDKGGFFTDLKAVLDGYMKGNPKPDPKVQRFWRENPDHKIKGALLSTVARNIQTKNPKRSDTADTGKPGLEPSDLKLKTAMGWKGVTPPPTPYRSGKEGAANPIPDDLLGIGYDLSKKKRPSGIKKDSSEEDFKNDPSKISSLLKSMDSHAKSVGMKKVTPKTTDRELKDIFFKNIDSEGKPYPTSVKRVTKTLGRWYKETVWGEKTQHKDEYIISLIQYEDKNFDTPQYIVFTSTPSSKTGSQKIDRFTTISKWKNPLMWDKYFPNKKTYSIRSV